MLPLSDDTDMHQSVLVESIGDTGYQSLTLHRVSLKPSYVTSDVTVGIVDKLPMLPGNGHAGGKVVCAVLCENPIIDETCKTDWWVRIVPRVCCNQIYA